MTQEKAHIIIVEDNSYDAEITAEAFKIQSSVLSIKILTDGARALDYIFNVCAGHNGKSWPHLIVLDLKLPKLHGLEVLAHLRIRRADQRPTHNYLHLLVRGVRQSQSLPARS